MRELTSMRDLRCLPLLREGVTARYEGSIDKTGGNADWDWALYQDERGEWVLFDHQGAGCVYNFVQHRYPDSPEPTFRFYFDGEEEPRFVIRHSQFGEVYPFIEPLASRYIGPLDGGRGPIRVVRSFVPMPYAKSCKITSDMKLEGCRRECGEGGWGHVIAHAYTDGREVETFRPDEEGYTALAALWKTSGGSVIPFEREEREESGAFSLRPGESRRVLAAAGAGLISGIRCRTRDYRREDLAALWLRAVWDGHGQADLELPFGCLFGNELGYHGGRCLLAGLSAEGAYDNEMPMPYWASAQLTVTNRGTRDIVFERFTVRHTAEYADFYREHPAGYFRAAPYYARRHTEGADSVLADIRGSGHIVGAVITGFGEGPEGYASCEGDVRVHIDGVRTPQIESDGSESYACYGWGFTSPPEYNPSSGYDGRSPASTDWSMVRFMTGDCYPFLESVRFGIESGEDNRTNYLEHSGAVFYYGRDETRRRRTAALRVGDEGSERENGFTCADETPVTLTSFFEGDDDETPVTLTGRYPRAGCAFRAAVPPETAAVILRRVSDQEKGRQKAAVFVDGEQVTEYPWYFADHNPCKRWLEDEFVIPARYVRGKETVTVRIVPEDAGEGLTWNLFGLELFAVPDNLDNKEERV